MSTVHFPIPTKTFRSNTYPSLSPTRPELSAKGKTIIITGGGTGIGAETARQFAAAGASRIALLGRREQPLLDTKASIEQKYSGVEVFTASVDVTKKSQVDTAFADFVGQNGKIHVVVSNAAVSGPLEPVRDVDPTAFLAAVNTNIEGSLNVAQAFLRHVADDAVAIDVNSSAAHLRFGAGFSAYSVAKLAVFKLWDHVGVGNPNVRVYHIQPGCVDTDMNREAGGVAAFGYEDHVSLPATFSVWLASPEASFLNGKFLWANWDVDELKAQAKEIEGSEKLGLQLVGWPFGEDGWSLKLSDTASDQWGKA